MKIQITENDIKNIVEESIKRICEQVVDDTIWDGYFNAAWYLNDNCCNGEYYDEDNQITQAEHQLNQLNIPCGFNFSIYDTGGISGMGPDDEDGDIKCENANELIPLLNKIKILMPKIVGDMHNMLKEYYIALHDFIYPNNLYELQSYFEEYVENAKTKTITASMYKDYALADKADAERENY